MQTVASLTHRPPWQLARCTVEAHGCFERSSDFEAHRCKINASGRLFVGMRTAYQALWVMGAARLHRLRESATWRPQAARAQARQLMGGNAWRTRELAAAGDTFLNTEALPRDLGCSTTMMVRSSRAAPRHVSHADPRASAARRYGRAASEAARAPPQSRDRPYGTAHLPEQGPGTPATGQRMRAAPDRGPTSPRPPQRCPIFSTATRLASTRVLEFITLGRISTAPRRPSAPAIVWSTLASTPGHSTRGTAACARRTSSKGCSTPTARAIGRSSAAKTRLSPPPSTL